MGLEKYWANPARGEDNFIVFEDATIYRIKVKEDHYNKMERELSRGMMGDNFVGMPIVYLRNVEYRSDDKYLRLHYHKDSEDEILISNPSMRKEVFDYLKEHTSIKEYAVKKPPLFGRIKKPLIALLVVVGIFAYVYSIIDGMNQGYEYEVRGRQHGLASIILVLADFGLEKNIMFFSPLAAIAIISIIRKLRNNSPIHRLRYK